VLPPLGSKLRRWRITLSRHRHRVLLLAVCCSIWITGASQAALISTAIKTASPLPAGANATITAEINKQVAKLSNPDATVVRAARQALIDEADTSGGGASDAYQTQYVNTLVTALTPLLMGQDKVLQRNAAVIIGGVAGKVEKNDLADLFKPQIEAMVKSKDVAVAYWGVKAARFALQSAAIKTGKDGGFGKIIVDCVKNSKDGSVLIEEAYQGLTFDSLKSNPPGGPRAQGALSAVGLSFLLDLLEWRVGLYRAGTPPGNPQADSIATGFLPYTAWHALQANTQLRDRAMKDVGEIACVQLMTGVNDHGAELVDATQRTGESIFALGSQMNDDLALKAAGAAFKSVTTSLDENKAKAICDQVDKALTAHNIHISKP
jgi:hypothetical protein